MPMTNSINKAKAGRNALWLAVGNSVGWVWVWIIVNHDTGGIGVVLLFVYLTALSIYAWNGMGGVIDAFNYMNLESFGLFGIVITVLICVIFGLVIPPIAMVYWIVRWVSLSN